MRGIFKYLMFALALVFACSSSAASIDASGLTDEQLLQLKAQAATIAANNAAEGKKAVDDTTSAISEIISDPNAMSSWGNQAAAAAKGFAEAIGIAATTVGVSVNEFVKTDAGTLVVIGIGLKLFGPMFVSFTVAILGFFITFFLARSLIRLFLGIDRVEKGETKKLLWGLYEKTPERIIYTKLDKSGDGAHLFIFVTMAAAFVCFIVITVNVI